MSTGGHRPDGDGTPGSTGAPPEGLPIEPDDGLGTPGSTAAEGQSSFMAGLFGRGLLYVAVTALPIVTATIVSPVLAHLLGPAEFGLFASAIALHQVLMAVAVFGFDQALILVRAESGSDRAGRMLVTVGSLLGLAVTVLFGTTAHLWSGALGFGTAGALAVATACWTAPATLAQLGLAFLMAQDRLKAFAVVSVLMTVGSQVTGLTFVLMDGGSATHYGWGYIGGMLLAGVASLFLVRPSRPARTDSAAVRGAFALGLPIMLSNLSGFVLNSGDRLVLQRLLGPAEVGRYQIAYTIGAEVFTVFALTGRAWAARFAEVRDAALRWRLIGQARDHLYELLAPAILGVNLGAPLLLRIFAPASFRPEGLLLTVLLVSLSGIPTVALVGSTRALITQRRTAPIALGAGVAAVVNLVLCFALVPVMGLEGAALATAIAFSTMAVIQRLAFRPFADWPRTSARLVAGLVAVTAVSAVFAYVDQSPRWIVIRTVLAALCGVWMIVVFLRQRAAHRRGEDLSAEADLQASETS